MSKITVKFAFDTIEEAIKTLEKVNASSIVHTVTLLEYPFTNEEEKPEITLPVAVLSSNAFISALDKNDGNVIVGGRNIKEWYIWQGDNEGELQLMSNAEWSPRPIILHRKAATSKEKECWYWSFK